MAATPRVSTNRARVMSEGLIKCPLTPNVVPIVPCHCINFHANDNKAANIFADSFPGVN